MPDKDEPINVFQVYRLVNDLARVFRLSTEDANLLMRDVYEVEDITDIDTLRKAAFEYASRLTND